MSRRLALLLCVTTPLAAQAETLTVGQAKTAAISDHYANVYYTVVEGAYEVVITLAPHPDASGRPMRFVSRLADGDSQKISLGDYGDDTLVRTLTVRRAGAQVSFAIDTTRVSWRPNVTANSGGAMP